MFYQTYWNLGSFSSLLMKYGEFIAKTNVARPVICSGRWWFRECQKACNPLPNSTIWSSEELNFSTFNLMLIKWNMLGEISKPPLFIILATIHAFEIVCSLSRTYLSKCLIIYLTCLQRSLKQRPTLRSVWFWRLSSWSSWMPMHPSSMWPSSKGGRWTSSTPKTVNCMREKLLVNVKSECSANTWLQIRQACDPWHFLS